MKSDQRQVQKVEALADPQPEAMESQAHTPTEGGILSYRELNSSEVVAVSGGPQVTNDEVVPPPV